MNSPVFDFEVDPRRTIRIGDTWYRDFQGTLPEGHTDRMAQGYMCLNCFEPFAHAYPEICNLCGYEVRKNQAADFQREYKGTEYIGTASLDSQYEYARELSEEQKMRERAAKIGIVVP
jgi:predicted amidophosphoribosyltransferase